MRPFVPAAVVAGGFALTVAVAPDAAWPDDPPAAPPQDGGRPADAPPAGDPATDPAAALLAAAHAKHADLVAAGLRSFQVRVTLRRADDPNVEKVRDGCAFTYTFTAPDQEDFDFGDTLEAVRKPLQTTLTGLWREVTGALWFREMGEADGLRLDAAKSATSIAGATKLTGEFEASFAGASGPLVSATFAADKATRTWTCDESPAGFRVRRREIALGGKVVYVTTYDVFRTVEKLSLPTLVAFDVAGKRTEFHLEYRRLNEKRTWADEPDAAVVKAAVEAFEKGWKALDDAGKVRSLREVAEFDSDLASASIAKVALKDASPAVREQAAEALGLMKRPNVVPQLLAALPANEKEIKVYLRVIGALGEIGDARAVDALSKDWWNQRVPEYAAAAAFGKIRALGKIRDARSVDALLDTFTITSEDKIQPFKAEIVTSLKALTGQDFLYDRRAWADWWKRNRATYRF